MTTAIRQHLPAAVWDADPIHSTVGFAVKYMVSTSAPSSTATRPRSTRRGRAAPVRLGRSGSIVIKDPNFHAHLQSPDFFDTERHPAITFDSDVVPVDGDDWSSTATSRSRARRARVEARGELTPVHEDLHGNERVGIQLEAAIDRSHFGVSWNAPLPKGGLALANETKLVVDLFFVKS